MQQKATGKDDIFLDNLDREGLIDDILNLEKSFSLCKVKLIMEITEVLKHCLVKKVRVQLMEMIAKIMARRPRVSLFKQKIFESYNYEIDILKKMTEIVHTFFVDVKNEEEHCWLEKYFLFYFLFF